LGVGEPVAASGAASADGGRDGGGLAQPGGDGVAA